MKRLLGVELFQLKHDEVIVKVDIGFSFKEGSISTALRIGHELDAEVDEPRIVQRLLFFCG